jgi:hypothetical protein
LGFFSAPNKKGQAPSACEQVNIAAKADCGLKLSSYVLENPIIGWASAHILYCNWVLPSGAPRILLVPMFGCHGNNASFCTA